jgi:hypothetical protein
MCPLDVTSGEDIPTRPKAGSPTPPPSTCSAKGVARGPEPSIDIT